MNDMACLRLCIMLSFSSLASVTTFSGCGVNHQGLVRVSPYENSSAYLIEMEAWGLHLSTRAADAGLSIGYTKKIYVLGKSQHTEGRYERIIQLDRGTSFDNLKKTTRLPSKKDWNNTIAVIDTIEGLKIYGNSWHGLGILAGIQNYAAMRLPMNFNGIVAFNLDTGNRKRNFVNIREEGQ